MGKLRGHRPSASMVVAAVALVVALSGTAIAASLVKGDSLIKKNSLSGNRLRNHSVTGKQIKLATLGKVPSASLADSATNASSATNSSALGGSPASSYERFGSTLPSGQSESGDYGIRVPTTAAGFLDTTVSFPIPLAAHIDGSHVVFTTIAAPATHCSGPGHADAGYLCIYEDHHDASVIDPPSVNEYEDGSLSAGAGRFGFTMEWQVTNVSPYSLGTWTVTAP